MKIGALFYGTGALDLAVERTWGGDLAWLAEFDKNVAQIGAWNNQGVPNLGDVTRVDWRKVEPVDVLTGGSPCQDLSHAGSRRGMTEGTRSNLWVAMREAVAVLRPSLVVWENVRGAYTASADSSVEPCPRCVGDGRGTSLRALGRVLGDLADLGYDARWHGLTASEIGAPHDRYRTFLLAYPFGSAPPNPDDHRQEAGRAIENRWAHPDDRVRALQLSRRGHWGRFQPGVTRWASLTRPAPFPLDENNLLSVRFAEWMMGLPEGWVSAVPGIARKSAMRACGNGVVPQQAEVAFRLMCGW